MDSVLVHIEIYFRYHTDSLEKKELKGKTFNIYNIEDRDGASFTEYMFRECMHDYIKQGDDDTVRIIEGKDLRDRLWLFQNKIQCTPTNLVHKLRSAIEYIEKNRSNYLGIKVIW